MLKAFASTEDLPWQQTFTEATSTRSEADVSLGGVLAQHWLGFGGCFNELGWRALNRLSVNERDRVLNALFDEDGLALSYNRIPIGANDYAESWYSHDEIGLSDNDLREDFRMEQFSIHRDHRNLIPFLKAAVSIRGGSMSLFASPWSPPTWMKFPAAHNYGRLIWEPAYRKAYALYFVKFLRAYEELGLPIEAVHVQNEPDSDQKFPSCMWTGERLRDFIRDDLAPAFRDAALNTQIWLGTIERGSFNDWIAPTLYDAQARAQITGLGFQWAGKHAVQRTRKAAPELAIIQTENECGDGENTWEHAHYVFDLMQHYLANGASAYVYWNMVLETGGRSTWGWSQNSLFCVDPLSGRVTTNPEYWLMRHVAGSVRPGAQVVAVEGRWAANALAFRNADGREVIVVQNPLLESQKIVAQLTGIVANVTLPPRSFVTISTT